jgi:hypothetical protein
MLEAPRRDLVFCRQFRYVRRIGVAGTIENADRVSPELRCELLNDMLDESLQLEPSLIGMLAKIAAAEGPLAIPGESPEQHCVSSF